MPATKTPQAKAMAGSSNSGAATIAAVIKTKFKITGVTAGIAYR